MNMYERRDVKLKPLHITVICGDREWAKYDPIAARILALKKKYGDDLLIVEGGAPGADQMAGFASESNDVHFAVIKALWDTRHRGAGPQRNEIMRRLAPDEVFGFHENIKESKGTKEMLTASKKAGIPTYLYSRGKTALYRP